MPDFSILNSAVMAMDPGEEEPIDTSNVIEVNYEEENISKATIYANIYNQFDDSVKYDNYYNIAFENNIRNITDLKQIMYEDISEDFIEELETEEYYEPQSQSLIYKYSDGAYQFAPYDSEEINPEFYPESALPTFKGYLEFEVGRLSIRKEEFIEKFGEQGYIKFKNGNEIIGEININSSLSTMNELYIETETQYDAYTIETSTIEDGTTFIIKLSEKGEATSTAVKYEYKYPSQNTGKKNTQYISTKIAKQNVTDILGEEGYIKIYSLNIEDYKEKATLVATINNQTEADENGNYVINYEPEIDRIRIETSEIIGIGKFNFYSTKEIVKDINYSTNAVKAFQKLKNTIKITTRKADNTKEELEKNIYIDMLNTKTEATLEINKEVLTAIGTNENVEFKIELHNSTLESDLWATPMFVIELPDGIESVEIKKSDILFDTELQIENVEIIEYNNHKAIKVEVSGKETKYINSSIATGTNIIINASIKLEKLVSIDNNEIQFYYYNEYATEYTNKVENLFEKDYVGHLIKLIDYVAPSGVFIIQGLENYNPDEIGIYSNEVESGEVEGKLKIYADEVKATSKQTIINNSGNNCENVIAIGRTMFIGNTNIGNGAEFATNVNTVLNGAIKANMENVEIYYSENAEATTEIELPENAWVKEVTDYSKVKSYMLIISNFEDKKILEFEYEFIIPEKLEYCSEMYSNFRIDYTRNTEAGDANLKAISNILKLSTGIGPKMKIETKVSVGNETEINERERIKYTIKLINTGSIDIQNIEIKDTIPTGTVYTEYIERNSEFDKSGYIQDPEKKEVVWNIETLPVGETIEKEFEVVVNDLPTIEEYYGEYPNFTKEDNEYYLIEIDETTGEETKVPITRIPDIYVKNYATFISDGFEKEIASNETTNKVNKIYFEVNETSTYVKEAYILENQEYKYNIIITNNSDEILKNIIATKEIPDAVEFVEAYQLKNGEKIENAIFNKETTELTWTIEEIDRNEIVQLEVLVKTKQLPEDTYERKIITNTSVTDEKGKKYVSNEVENNIAKPKISMEVTVKPNTQYVKEKDIITFNIIVKNIGHVTLEQVKIIDDLPKELICKSIKYKKGDTVVNTTAKANGDVEINITLKAEETVEVEIITTTGNLDKTKNEIDVTSIISVEAKNIEKIEERINQIIQVLKEDEEVQDKFKIKGLAWFDENKNGRREKSETLLSGIIVYAINAKGEIVGETKTNIIGEYYFEELPKGEYLVAFLYDSNQYTLTQYQVQNVELELNSDVIQTYINLNGNIYNRSSNR